MEYKQYCSIATSNFKIDEIKNIRRYYFRNMNNKPINFIFNKKRIITFCKKMILPIFFTGVFVINDIHKGFGLWREILFAISILIYIVILFFVTFTEEGELRIF